MLHRIVHSRCMCALCLSALFTSDTWTLYAREIDPLSMFPTGSFMNSTCSTGEVVVVAKVGGP